MSVPQIIAWILIFANGIMLIWNGVLLKRNCALREQAVSNLKASKTLLEHIEIFHKKCEENENDERKNEYPSSTDGTENT